MSTQVKHYRANWWRIDVTNQPWYIDLLVVALVAFWMALTYSTMQMHEPTPVLVGSSVVVALVGVAVIYGQRVTYVNVADKIEIGLRTPEGYHPPTKKDNEED